MKKIISIALFLLMSIAGVAQLKVGDTAPALVLPNASDSLINLSSFNGKIVLIDFWASWCAPCRDANPYLVKLYNKNKAKGFEIYAVSIDTKKEAWLKAIKKDKLNYTLVNDNKGWNSKTGEQYFIDQIPTNFLLNREGKIVAINLEGKELFDKVSTLVKE